jgi:DNA sulfur modification protein DndC
MEAMINNDEEKKWMTPLSEFRNKYLDTNDHMHREFKRRNGALMLMNDKFTGKKKLIPGPYKQSYRKKLLSEVLKAQEVVRKSGVKGVDDFILINEDELQAIRKIWVEERNEIEDEVPRIYEEFTGKNYPFPELSENQIFNFEDLQLLNKEASQNGSLDDIHYQLTRNLISIEKKYSSSTRRTGIYDEIESALVKGAFETPDEALLFAKNKYEVNGKTDEIQPNERDSSGLFEVVEKVEDESELGD